LSAHLPVDVAGRLQIRVVELPLQTDEGAWNRSELCQ
jgi:hypothetical protein